MLQDLSDNNSNIASIDVTSTDSASIRKKPGRKPDGDRALTPAEKQKAYRDRKRAAKAAEAESAQSTLRDCPPSEAAPLAQLDEIEADHLLKLEQTSDKRRADLAELGLRLLGFEPEIFTSALDEDFHTHYLLSCVDVKFNSDLMKEKTGRSDISGWQKFYDGMRCKAPA